MIFETLSSLWNSDYTSCGGIHAQKWGIQDQTIFLITGNSHRNNDCVLDIASNDGTLLNSYNKKFYTVGIDPLVNRYKKHYKKIGSY